MGQSGSRALQPTGGFGGLANDVMLDLVYRLANCVLPLAMPKIADVDMTKSRDWCLSPAENWFEDERGSI